jgi:hypothetical protein
VVKGIGCGSGMRRRWVVVKVALYHSKHGAMGHGVLYSASGAGVSLLSLWRTIRLTRAGRCRLQALQRRSRSRTRG